MQFNLGKVSYTRRLNFYYSRHWIRVSKRSYSLFDLSPRKVREFLEVVHRARKVINRSDGHRIVHLYISMRYKVPTQSFSTANLRTRDRVLVVLMCKETIKLSLQNIIYNTRIMSTCIIYFLLIFHSGWGIMNNKYYLLLNIQIYEAILMLFSKLFSI